jgi:hypothetical protein
MKTQIRFLLFLTLLFCKSFFLLPASGDPAPTTFYPFNGGATATISSGTTVTLSRLGSLSTYVLTLGTGSGPYTARLVLPDTGFHSGDVYFIPVSYPASTDPTLQIVDSGTGGTVLHSSTGTALAGSAVLRFVNVTGTAWSFNSEGAVLQRNLGAGVYPALAVAPNSAAGLLTGSGVGVYSAVSGLNVTSSGPGQFTLSGTPSTSGSSMQSGTANALASSAPVLASQVRSINPSAHHAFGDSVTAGYFVTPAQAYPTLISDDLGTVLTNYAISGDLAADVSALQVFPNENPGATDNPLYTIITGANEANTKGAGAYEAVFNLNLQAIMAWLATPGTAKTLAQSGTAGGVTTTGVWTADNTYQTGIGLSSTTASSTMTLPITTYGRPIYVWYRVWDGNGGTFTCAVDSGSATALTCYTSPAIATQNGGTQGVGLARFSAVTSGTHAVTLSVTSTSGTGNRVSVLGVGTPAVPGQYWNPPTVFCGGVWEQESNANASATLAYNNDAQADVALLAGDGLPVYFVNIRAYVNDTTDMANTLHFNATGHLHLRNAFEQQIQAPVNFSKALGAVSIAALSGSLGGTLDAQSNSITQLGPITMANQSYPTFGTAPLNTEMGFLTSSPTDDYGYGLQNGGQWNFSVSYPAGGYNWWIGGTGTNTGAREMSLEGALLTLGTGVSGTNPGTLVANTTGVGNNTNGSVYSWASAPGVPFNSVISADSTLQTAPPSSPSFEIFNTDFTDGNTISLAFGTTKTGVGGAWVTTGAITMNVLTHNTSGGVGLSDMDFYTSNAESRVTEKMVLKAAGDLVIGGTNDNGFKLESVGPARVDGNSTVLGGSQTITTTGTSAASGPGNTSTPAVWEKVLVNGTTAYRALYQ